jgi:segregation and condensation protein B
MSAAKKSRPATTKNLGLESFQKPAAETGLSLESLSAAFSEMLSSGDDPYEAPPEETHQPAAADESDPLAELASEPQDSVDDACEICPRTIVEAMLFVGRADGEPLTGQQIAGFMRGVRAAEIDEIVTQINADYAERNCPYVIVAQGAGYRLSLRPEYDRLRDRFLGRNRDAKLSHAAIEVLSVVAYNQPVTSEQVNTLRAHPCGSILSQLVRRQLLRLEKEKGARPKYFTTSRFLQLFGLSSLDDLPRSDESEPQ